MNQNQEIAKDTIKLVDLGGNELHVDDIILYATKCTNSAYLRTGIITSIELFGKNSYYSGNVKLCFRSIIPKIHGKWDRATYRWTPKLHVTGLNRICYTSTTVYDSVTGKYNKVPCTPIFEGYKYNGTFKDLYTGIELDLIKNSKYSKYV